MDTIINGIAITIKENDLNKSLLTFIREDLDLTGTKNGCEIGVCGACTVLIDQKAERSCKKKVSDVIGKEVITIEGFTPADGTLHPLQQAFLDCGAVQCGFCTPGMVLTAHALLLKNERPTRKEIRQAININICRCTGYQQIIDAIEKASVYYQTKNI